MKKDRLNELHSKLADSTQTISSMEKRFGTVQDDIIKKLKVDFDNLEQACTTEIFKRPV